MATNVSTNFRADETVYAAIADLEWDDLWDEYERTLKAFDMAHERPREKYGITDTDAGALFQQLRILDTRGEAIATIRRCQNSLHKAEGKLKTGLHSLPPEWYSAKVFHRLLCLLDLPDCTLTDSVTQAFRKMKVDCEVLPDLLALSRTLNGFEIAIELLVKASSAEARSTLVKIAADLRPDGPEAARLNDAAVAISVNMNDPHVIPILIHRLVVAYAEAGQTESDSGNDDDSDDAIEPGSEIIASLMAVIQSTHESLSPKLLKQLSCLGLVNASSKKASARNPHLGVRQDLISRDLTPVRVAAATELKRRNLAG